MILSEPLNTLFVTLPGAYLAKDHENLVVKVEQKERVRVPLHHVGSVVLFGGTIASIGALGVFAERGIQVSFLTAGGKFLGRVEGQGGSLLRKAQYAAANSPKESLKVAQGVVLGKLANQRQMVMRSARDAPPEPARALRRGADGLSKALSSARKARDIDVLRGFEGYGASVYFETFPSMLRNRANGVSFEKRQRRPPMDPVLCQNSALLK